MPTATEVKVEPEVLDVHAMVAYARMKGAKAMTVTFARRLLNTGQIDSKKIGKAYYTTKDALDVWLARGSKRR